VDFLLFDQNGFRPHQCQQNADERSCLMSWILNDRGIHDVAEQEAAGEIGQIVADEDGLVRQSAVDKGLGIALCTGTDIAASL
jgi:hypothetical protein